MSTLDRTEFIARLERLGADDDATALEAARALDRSMRESGLTWDDLLRPESDADDDADEDEDEDHEDEAAEDIMAGDAAPEGAEDAPAGEAEDADPPDGPVTAAELAEDAKLLDRLLARKRLSRSLRAELTDLKRAIDEGDFDAMDSRYLRALAKRLGL